MHFLRRKEFIIVVFITGAAVLVVEILATRILAPYFGNTIYTYSSIIGVILAALSAGYYIGGTMADKRPKAEVFYAIILFSAIFTVLIDVMSSYCLPWISRSFSMISGPLVASILLFFVPSLLLGTLSPYCIKLQSLKFPEMGIGKISGEVFFWSTLGSILGSLLSGFYLIPSFGIKAIIICVSLVLFVISLIGLVSKKNFKKSQLLITLVFVLSIGASGFVKPPQANGTVFETEGRYERIAVVDKYYDLHPARFMRLEMNESSAIFRDSDDLVFDYTKYYALYKLAKPEIKNVLVLGSAAYTIPRAFLNADPNVHVDVVDVEPKFYELAKKYFGLTDNERLTSYVEDARRFLLNTDKKYDAIFSDLYLSIHAVPTHTFTKEFFELARSRLTENGIFIANSIGDLYTGPDSLILSEIATVSSAFDNSYFFGMTGAKASQVQNIVAIGVNGDKKLDLSENSLEHIGDGSLRHAYEHLIDTSTLNLGNHLIFIDDYAPVELYNAKAVRRFYSE